MDTHNSKELSRFWEAYGGCAEENRVPPDRLPFYVNWAKSFANFLPGKALKERTGKDIETFLADLRKRQGIADWQVRQAEHALKILYEIFLPRYAPEKYAPAVRPGKHPPQETDEFRDQVIPGEVERRFSALIEAVKTEIRSRHYSYRTETSYLDWVRRFIAFHGYANPGALNTPAAMKTYLDYLAVEREVTASTQNQALNALVFFYREVLQKPIGEIEEFARAKRPRRLPEVMTRDEVQRLLSKMSGVTGLMAGLMYGSGMRLMECVRLRVKDIDFTRHQIMVRDGKGQKDRVTMLPDRFAAPLQEHLARVKVTYEQDLAQGTADVYIWPPWQESIRIWGRSGSGSMRSLPKPCRLIRVAAR